MTLELHEHFDDWPNEKTVFDVSDVELRVREDDHPLFLANRAAIDGNWHKELAANPALFDGRMVLYHSTARTEDRIIAQGHIVPYRAFLWWRKQPERQGAIHIHAYPVLQSSDGALIAIKMGAHTANAGLVYFACGSFEAEDVFNGICNADHNMRREVLEETGLDLQDARTDTGFHVSHIRRAITLFRLYRFNLTAAEMVAKIEQHMTVAEDKEIAGVVAIRSADHAAHNYHVGMLPILNWYFGDQSTPV
ncbi:NUDIX hydrolase [Rhizobium sp. NTR19]|uniref:NUDIX hydrolase n=1 Tax=Neorhizobium turbinariae TaxID=2937795 RepID=A0ABT0IT11_9HYPH|nr:NUDIX hydrolase [Neorhizobium turbinariae]MCK8781019.1 NUDIX hydrolase [Neorhizobium turbinariae]